MSNSENNNEQYNLLFIFTDEQRADTLSSYNNSTIHMPNLNALASKSFVFEKTYVTQPVCTPSRSSLLTGLYPHQNGCTENNIPLREETKTIAEMIGKNYKKGYYGKWHLGDEIFKQHGFHDWVSIEDYYIDYYTEARNKEEKSSYHKYLISQGFTPNDGKVFARHEITQVPEGHSKPAFLAREASRFIKENKESPFILYVNFLEPHMPFSSCRDSQYSTEEIPLPDNFTNTPTDDQPLKAKAFHELYKNNGYSGHDLTQDKGWREIISNYWGLCSLVDTHLKTIIDTLVEHSLYEKTIIVFTSDHGDMMGSHGLLAKCVMFEEAARVPLLIHLPGQEKEVRISSPISQIDIVPTLLDLLNQNIPKELPGTSITPLLYNSDESVLKRDVFLEWNGPNTGFGDRIGKVTLPQNASTLTGVSQDNIEKSVTDPVRSIITQDGWKFNKSTIGEDELYNLNEDPLELNNLVETASLKPIIFTCEEKINQWKKDTCDT